MLNNLFILVYLIKTIRIYILKYLHKIVFYKVEGVYVMVKWEWGRGKVGGWREGDGRG